MTSNNERPNPWTKGCKAMPVATFELADGFGIKAGSAKPTWKSGTKVFPTAQMERSDSAIPLTGSDGSGKIVATHSFTLILSGIAAITPELANAFREATQGDIELNQRDGVIYVEFDRTAATLRDAVTSAIREIECAAVGVRVIRVESEAVNVIAKINAGLLGLAGS